MLHYLFKSRQFTVTRFTGFSNAALSAHLSPSALTNSHASSSSTDKNVVAVLLSLTQKTVDGIDRLLSRNGDPSHEKTACCGHCHEAGEEQARTVCHQPGTKPTRIQEHRPQVHYQAPCAERLNSNDRQRAQATSFLQYRTRSRCSDHVLGVVSDCVTVTISPPIVHASLCSYPPMSTLSSSQ